MQFAICKEVKSVSVWFIREGLMVSLEQLAKPTLQLLSASFSPGLSAENSSLNDADSRSQSSRSARLVVARNADFSCMMRIAQHRLIIVLSYLGKRRDGTMVIARHGKHRRHIVAQQRDISVVDALRDGGYTASLIAIG